MALPPCLNLSPPARPADRSPPRCRGEPAHRIGLREPTLCAQACHSGDARRRRGRASRGSAERRRRLRVARDDQTGQEHGADGGNGGDGSCAHRCPILLPPISAYLRLSAAPIWPYLRPICVHLWPLLDLSLGSDRSSRKSRVDPRHLIARIVVVVSTLLVAGPSPHAETQRHAEARLQADRDVVRRSGRLSRSGSTSSRFPTDALRSAAPGTDGSSRPSPPRGIGPAAPSGPIPPWARHWPT
jgi:hypothetical protein